MSFIIVLGRPDFTIISTIKIGVDISFIYLQERIIWKLRVYIDKNMYTDIQYKTPKFIFIISFPIISPDLSLHCKCASGCVHEREWVLCASESQFIGNSYFLFFYTPIKPWRQDSLVANPGTSSQPFSLLYTISMISTSFFTHAKLICFFHPTMTIV